eukprot:1470360-Rhodomonas_salina.2
MDSPISAIMEADLRLDNRVQVKPTRTPKTQPRNPRLEIRDLLDLRVSISAIMEADRRLDNRV